MFKKPFDKVVSPTVPLAVKRTSRTGNKRKREEEVIPRSVTIPFESKDEKVEEEPPKKKLKLSGTQKPSMFLLAQSDERSYFRSLFVPFKNKGTCFGRYVFSRRHMSVIDKHKPPIHIVNPDLSFDANTGSFDPETPKRSESGKKPKPKKKGKDPFIRDYNRKSKRRTFYITNLDGGSCEEWGKLFTQVGSVDLFRGKENDDADGENEEKVRPPPPFDWKTDFSDFRGQQSMNSGYVIFSENDTVSKMQSPEGSEMADNSTIVPPPKTIQTQRNFYRSNYNCGRVSDPGKEKGEITEWLEDYDVKKRKERNLLRTIHNKKDDDGWTYVVPKDTEKVAAEELDERGDEEKKLRAMHGITGKSSWAKKRLKKKERRRKENEKYALYEHQRIERKKIKLRSLKEKFQNDLRRIEEMKKQRKFVIK